MKLGEISAVDQLFVAGLQRVQRTLVGKTPIENTLECITTSQK